MHLHSDTRWQRMGIWFVDDVARILDCVYLIKIDLNFL